MSGTLTHGLPVLWVSHVEGGVEEQAQQGAAAAARFHEGVVEEVVAAAEPEHDGAIGLLACDGEVCAAALQWAQRVQ